MSLTNDCAKNTFVVIFSLFQTLVVYNIAARDREGSCFLLYLFTVHVSETDPVTFDVFDDVCQSIKLQVMQREKQV